MVISSLRLLQSILTILKPERPPAKSEAGEHLKILLQNLVDKAGDKNPRVNELAEKVFLKLSTADLVGSKLCLL